MAEARFLSPPRGELPMATPRVLHSGATLIALTLLLLSGAPRPQAQPAAPAVPIDAGDIGGVVTGKHGPEAGVWGIAETTELRTRVAKMVGTDEHRRYGIPDLPAASDRVWGRGY